MSIKEAAKYEMKLINVSEEDQKVMNNILDIFFSQWDSGGAVRVASEMLNRLICGKCLSPLTGKSNEWMEVSDGLFQNKRISSVFYDTNKEIVYDLDHPKGRNFCITFPYYPEEAKVASPVMEI